MRIKISKRNEELLDRITRLYNFKNDSILARIAFSYSIQRNKRFSILDNYEIDSDGKEFRDDKALFGTFISEKSNYFIFKSILCQHYEKALKDDEFIRLFKLHLNDGIERINNEIKDCDITTGQHIDYLIKLINKGTGLVSVNSFISRKYHTKANILSCDKLVYFQVGKNEVNEEITINLNKDFEPQHMAVAGMTRSGKTEFIKYVLAQINKVTNGELKFIFFDYKGEGKSESLNNFLKQTNCQFVNIDKVPFEFNPLAGIEMNEERQMMIDITSFVDSIAAVEPRLGTAQKHILRSLLVDCFSKKDKSKIPTVDDLFNKIKAFYEQEEKQPDTLYSIVENLCGFIFKEPVDYSKKIFHDNIYLNLPATATDTLRLICVYMILKYVLFEFLRTEPVVQNSEGIKPLRYVIVIDEAHVYLRSKSSRKVLEDFLRLISSKGVAVVLLSQGVEDYKHKDFDFTSQVKLTLCLNIMNKDFNTIKNFLGTPRNESALRKAIDQLNSGKGIINLENPQIISINQFWRDSKI